MHLPCSTILYRAITRSGWLDPDDGSVKPEAFFRRDPQDQNGLSLFRADRVTAKECLATFRKNYGIVSLHVGKLRDFGLTVTSDASDDSKALVVDLPFENPETADDEKLAGDVAKSARKIGADLI